ncbi:oligopeptidase B, partial [Elusimicrobiota bacterium]
MSARQSPARRPRLPIAARKPRTLVNHGDERVDHYYWLKKRGSPAVLSYLKRENAYFRALMAPARGLRKKLFREIKSRIKQDDASVPYRFDEYLYYYRYIKGKEYRVYCRKKGGPHAPEEIVLDVNKLAKGRAYCDVGPPVPSPDHSLIAYAADTKGRRLYTVRFKDLRTGRTLKDSLPLADGSMAWSSDGRHIFYVVQDEETLRSCRVLRHALGGKRDRLVFEEKDEAFSVDLDKSRSRKYLMIASASTLTTEVRVLETDRPNGRLRLFSPREPGHEYSVVHGGDRFYVLTNLKARNFRLMETSERKTHRRHWKQVLAHRRRVLIEDVDAFAGHLVIEEREGGLTRLSVIDRRSGAQHRVALDEPAYSVFAANNFEYDAARFRFFYESLTTPESVFDYDMDTREMSLRKRREIPGGFKPERYRSERILAKAPDGTAVPISLVYRKDARRKGRAPLLLSGYGAYGISYDPDFSSDRLSL